MKRMITHKIQKCLGSQESNKPDPTANLPQKKGRKLLSQPFSKHLLLFCLQENCKFSIAGTFPRCLSLLIFRCKKSPDSKPLISFTSADHESVRTRIIHESG